MMATPIPQNRAAFSISEILAATGGSVRGPLGDAASAGMDGVTTDTRQVQPGQAFIALKGERFDGHDHLAAAAARGASLAIVERDIPCDGITILRVASALDALGKLAAFHLARWREKTLGSVVAITGSAGKTTTKRATAALLEARLPGQVHASRGNLNNLIGVPMTVLALEDSARVLVLELGTNAPGEIGKLARMVKPDIAVVTLIADAHNQGLGDLSAIAREKTALFRELGPEGIAIGNVDDDRIRGALLERPADFAFGYGFSSRARYRIEKRELRDNLQQIVDLRRGEGWQVSFVTPLLGAAGALACAAAVAVADAPHFDVTSNEIEAAFEPLDGKDEGPGRLQPRELPSGLVLIDDSYNSNPASARASIEAAKEIAAALGRPLVLVLGEMRELGAASEKAHDSLGSWVADSGARLSIFVGVQAERAAARARRDRGHVDFCGDSDEAAAKAALQVQPGDLVLVKGSRGVRMERVVAALADRHGGRP